MVKQEIAHFQDLRLDGGELCLDFANTIHDRKAEEPRDYLGSAGDLVGWLEYSGGISKRQAAVLRDRTSALPEASAKIYRRGIQLREAIFGVFSSLADGKVPQSEDLQILNKCVEDALRARVLTHERGTINVTWKDDSSPDTILGMIALSAYNLATSERLLSVKLCPRCHWLFLDKSKNQRRRWCSMETCGSNDKALNYYYRSQKAARKKKA